MEFQVLLLKLLLSKKPLNNSKRKKLNPKMMLIVYKRILKRTLEMLQPKRKKGLRKLAGSRIKNSLKRLNLSKMNLTRSCLNSHKEEKIKKVMVSMLLLMNTIKRVLKATLHPLED